VSLVSDALRKARQHDARRGALLPAVLIPSVRRSRLGQGIVLGAAVALLAAAAGAGIVWWLAGRHGSAGAVATVVAGAGMPGTPVGSTGAATSGAPVVGLDETTPKRPQAGSRAAEPQQAEGAPASTGTSDTLKPPAAAAAATVPNGAPSSEPHAGPDRAAVDTSSHAEEGEERHQAQGPRVYILDADLGYAKLHLDYLVYKPSSPFGRINGQDVIVGSLVDGFVVEEIGPDYIKLRDRHGPLVLRVH
jgi:hypothetical protein